ncbi:MAG: cbb3-type cytochrome c oxidase subunit 3 [Beijerinckiaceae bacterium]|jgi:cbb3-type cytochrome oxidase subunit 3|nr:cbb3-type cytochrome c oxidase subunit 3 [Beijerinckiaceae bacterium]MDO9439574.1 cbb3-type cytochrome c oxidase subunit 3 [Beijerinckiaceae bacterium]
MNIQSLTTDAQTLSLVLVCITFSLIVAYAMWPSFDKKFDAASRLPLNED